MSALLQDFKDGIYNTFAKANALLSLTMTVAAQACKDFQPSGTSRVFQSAATQ